MLTVAVAAAAVVAAVATAAAVLAPAIVADAVPIVEAADTAMVCITTALMQRNEIQAASRVSYISKRVVWGNRRKEKVYTNIL